MFDFLAQEVFRSLLTAGGIAGIGGGLLLVVARLIERLVPSRDLAMTGEQLFRDTLIKRVSALEADRDRLSQEFAEQAAKYWELIQRYTALERAHEELTTRYTLLQREIEQLRQQFNGTKHPK